MSDDREIKSRANRMDDAFCARLRAAIAKGLESAPIGVVTTPGGGGGTTIVFDLERTMAVDDDVDRIVRLAK